MGKNELMVVWAVVIGLVALAHPVRAAEIDNSFTPITAAQLKSRLLNAKSELEFYELIRQGQRNRLGKVCVSVTRQLADSHPKNATYLGAHCYALGMTEDIEGTQDEYSDYMRKALKLPGDHWLILVLEGRAEMGYGLSRRASDEKLVDPAKAMRGFKMIKRAVEIAPNIAPTHFFLGEAYDSLAVEHYAETHKTDPHYRKLAEQETSIAAKLEPASSYVVMKQIWFDIYAEDSMAKARIDKQRFVDMVPNKSLLSADEKQMLALVKS